MGVDVYREAAQIRKDALEIMRLSLGENEEPVSRLAQRIYASSNRVLQQINDASPVLEGMQELNDIPDAYNLKRLFDDGNSASEH